MSRYRRRSRPEQFTVPVNQPTGPKPGPEILPWWWHPQREGAQPPPRAFVDQLKVIDPDLAVCFSPVHERWILWVKNPRIQHPICRGWQLLMLWEHPKTHEFLPLNELLFHNLCIIDANRYRNAVEYYERIQQGIEERKAARERAYQSDRKAAQKELFQSKQISSAGKGNKSALYDDGTIVNSPGDLAWRQETRRFRLPSAQLQQEKDEKEIAEYGR